MTRRIILISLILTLLVSCAPTATNRPVTTSPTNAPTSTPEPLPTYPWWRNAVFYEIFVRSYYDSNGDGIGDFNGITEKMDYIQSLGVNAIWLMPIHPSDTYHGYHVTNYYDVNPDYGTMDDFKRLTSEAHSRGIRIILDLVLNHTSNQHPWFLDANGNQDSPYRNYYIWAESYPGYNGPMGTAWHAAQNGGYYYGVFPSGIPDLNYTNPEVTAEMEDITRYWLADMGVDGFRLDAAKHIIEEGQKQENTPSTHAWFKDYYTFYKAINPETYTVGEVAGGGALLAKAYSGEMDQIFNFELANAILNSVRGEANSSITSAIKFALKDKPDGDYATFLSNHDQDRAINFIGGNPEKAKIAASILLTAPGTPYIYYGEEVGMAGRKPDEDIRRPMPWTSEPDTAGFSTALPWRPPSDGYQQINVAAQETDQNSLLNHYRAMIALRRAHSALRTGDMLLVETGNPGIYAILRYDSTETLLVLINLKGESIRDYQLSLAKSPLADGTFQPEILFGDGTAAPLNVNGGSFSTYMPIDEIPAYAIYLIKLK